jgi:hypothetical protein
MGDEAAIRDAHKSSELLKLSPVCRLGAAASAGNIAAFAAADFADSSRMEINGYMRVACQQGQVPLVDWILSHLLDPCANTVWVVNASMKHAAAFGRLDVCDRLLPECDAGEGPPWGKKRGFLCACENGERAVAAAALSRWGLSPQTTREGVHAAGYAGHMDIVRLCAAVVDAERGFAPRFLQRVASCAALLPTDVGVPFIAWAVARGASVSDCIDMAETAGNAHVADRIRAMQRQGAVALFDWDML